MQDAIPDAAHDNSPLSNGSVPILINDLDRAAYIMLYLHYHHSTHHSEYLFAFICLQPVYTNVHSIHNGKKMQFSLLRGDGKLD